jgi:hypothetical protein
MGSLSAHADEDKRIGWIVAEQDAHYHNGDFTTGRHNNITEGF